MEISSKSTELPSNHCEHRGHQDYSQPAPCAILEAHTGLNSSDLPVIQPDACLHCITHNKCKIPASEPFRSIYHKALIDGNPIPLRVCENHLECRLRGDMPGDGDILTTVMDCRVYGRCTITQVDPDIQSCQTCPRYIRREFCGAYHKELLLDPYPRTFLPLNKWSVGVITAPRTPPTIDRCMHALINGGFTNGIIFADHGVTYDYGKKWLCVQRASKLGLFRNMILALYELFIRDTTSDYYMLIQDDMLVGQATRFTLELATKKLEPSGKPHLIVPFAPFNVDCDGSSIGWKDIDMYPAGPNVIILSNATVRALITDINDVIQYHVDAVARGDTFEDLGIFHWAHKHGYKTYYPRPSLIDHIGYNSTHCDVQNERWVWDTRTVAEVRYDDVMIRKITSLKDYINIERELAGATIVQWVVLVTVREGYEDCLNNDEVANIAHSWMDYTEKRVVLSTGLVNGTITYEHNCPCFMTYIKKENFNKPLKLNTVHAQNRIYWTKTT